MSLRDPYDNPRQNSPMRTTGADSLRAIAAAANARIRNAPYVRSSPAYLGQRADMANQAIANSSYVRTSPNYKPAGSDQPDSSYGLNPSAPVGPTPAELAQQALDQKYAGVEARIGTIQGENQNAYTESQKKMAEFYGKAAEARKEPYAAGVQELAGNLGNLGMDFTSTDMAKDWDKNERNLQESADLALANDSAWFEKMKVVNKDLYDQMILELAQTKVLEAQMAADAAKGGGGGGGGGGGRSSGGGSLSGDIQADTNFEELFPGVIQGLGSMSPTDRTRRELQYDRYGDPDGVLAHLAERAQMEGRYMNRPSTPFRMSVNPVATARSVLNRLLPTAATISNRRTNADRNWWQSQSSRYGPVQTNSKINETSKDKKPTVKYR